MAAALLKRPFLHVLLIIISGLAVYSNTFDVPLQWDKSFIIENPVVKDISYFLEPWKAKGLEKYGALRDRYASYLTFALNYKANGFDVWGYHVVNLSIHLLNALLLYLLVVLIFRSPSEFRLKGDAGLVALVSALLFTLHPVQTEAVTYIYQRHTALAALFYLGSLVFYIKWRLDYLSPTPLPQGEGARGRVVFYLLSLLFALLAMKTKENAFTLPVAIALYEFVFIRGRRPFPFKALVPFFFTMLIIPLSVADFGRPLGVALDEATRTQTAIPRRDYLITQLPVMATYLRLLLLPVGQNLDYDYPVFDSVFAPRVFLSFLLIGCLFSFAVYLLIRSRKMPDLKIIPFGLMFFFIALSVESSGIALADLIFEHRLYLPSAGVFPAFVTAALLFWRRFGGRRHMVPVVTASLVLLSLGVATYARNEIWRSEVGLREDIARKSPGKARCRYNLSLAYMEEGRTGDAIKELRAALGIEPRYIEAHNNLGVILIDQGRPGEAMEHFHEVLRLNPDDTNAHIILGDLYLKQGEPDEAAEHYENALRLGPDDAKTHNNIAMAYGMKGDVEKTIEHLRRALALRPDYAKAHSNLGNAYKIKGGLDDAMEQYVSAIKLEPDYADAHFNLGVIFFEKGRMAEARREFETVLKISPDYPNARQILDRTTKRKMLK